ncbi:HAL/PAL/TAL family ammonia-lyase [Bradyrhizobium sp. USDA 3364]
MNVRAKPASGNNEFMVIESVDAARRRETPFVVKLNADVNLNDIHDVAVHRRKVDLAPAVLELVQKGRAQLENLLTSGKVIYGINTGFGGNSNLVISDDLLALHQSNLLKFLSAGTGDCLAEEHVRAAQFLTLLALVRGWSAVRPEIVRSLLEHINLGVVPTVPRHGSVGASGDLIPSSYIASALCGCGRVCFAGQEMSASEALSRAGITPVELQAKEGLALVNGTRAMTGIGALTVQRVWMTFRAALGALALAVDALHASREHYDARIHAAKGHPGQIAVAAALREMLACRSSYTSSGVHRSNEATGIVQLAEGVQEIYSIRCAPQILGIVPESLGEARMVIEREASSVNDNPLIDPETGDVLHGGNFMGQHVSRIMDALKIDIATVGNHMHAIMALLMDSRFSRGLPNSLSPRLGLYQGFKGVQMSHTSLVAHLRRESAPASVHTLPTEQFNQDIVSLGLHAALGAAEMELKLRDVVAMTLLAACQAVDLRSNGSELPSALSHLYEAVRKISAPLVEDRAMDRDIAAISFAIVEGLLPLPQCEPPRDAQGGGRSGEI